MPNRPLKVGVVLPIAENQMNGGSARWPDLRAMAKTAEDVGFDSIWIPDHLIFREPDSDGNQVEEGIWECGSMLPAFAAITERVEIGALVVCTGFRNPALLAKMFDTLDEISNGRMILGLGAGWHSPEYTAFGYPFDHRVSRFEEAIQIINPLLKLGEVDFHGKYYDATDCVLRPRGPRAGGPPILVGTTGDRMLDLTAHYADMWNVSSGRTMNDLAVLKEWMLKVDTACDRAGRDPATLLRTAGIKIEIGPHAPDPLNSRMLTGSTGEISDELRAYAKAGISHVQVLLEPRNLDGIRAFEPVLRQLDR